MFDPRRWLACGPAQPRRRLLAALQICGPLGLLGACAHAEAEAAPPEAPASAPAAAPPAKAPETILRVTSAPIESLRSPYFAVLEFTFQNPSGQWHQVRRVSIGAERQLLGPALEPLTGDHLRTWQLAARDASSGKAGPRHPALETLAPEAPAKAAPAAPAAPPAPDGGGPAAPVGPPDYLLTCPFSVAPGLFTRKWVALYSAAADALLGQDLVLSYELEDGKTERMLIQYPKPAAAKP
jgi:hypothetical protein